MQEIRYNSRRQYYRNEYDYRVSKVGCLLYGRVESSVADGSTFRATGGPLVIICKCLTWQIGDGETLK